MRSSINPKSSDKQKYPLKRCIISKNWNLVQHYLHLAHLPDENNSYPLHLICKDVSTPPHIIRMVYFAFPDVAMYLDKIKRTPLFIAVEYSFGNAVEFLLSQRPEAVLVRNGTGMLPIQYALRDLTSNRILIAILKSNTITAIELDEDGVVILERFFNEYNCDLRFPLKNKNSIFGWHKNIKQLGIHHKYSKGILLLKAFTMNNFGQSCLDNGDWLVLHVCCEVDACPWSFCNLVLQNYAEEAMKADDYGNLPIHIVLSAPRKLSDEHVINCYKAENRDNILFGDCQHFLGPKITDVQERFISVEPGK